MSSSIEVDVIIPVHNASATIVETVASAMAQSLDEVCLHVCCYDDGSTDDSWKLLQGLHQKYANSTTSTTTTTKQLWIARGEQSRGAGYARNRAAAMRKLPTTTATDDDSVQQRFLCMLDSDDTMDAHRVARQLEYLLQLPCDQRRRTIVGCTFQRDPPDATWHYAAWANGLTEERLRLERFREVTVVQPTWMMARERFVELGGYVEVPAASSNETVADVIRSRKATSSALCLIHPIYDTRESLRIAEDLRFFHAHMHQDGLLHLLRSTPPLVTYRHRGGHSQSAGTPRKLLLHLRALAFERCVLQAQNELWKRLCVWGAGRDGKDFVKALHPDVQKRIYCLAEVDAKKIDSGYYVNRELGLKIPIVHFSLLAADETVRRELAANCAFGRIDKSKHGDVKRNSSAAPPPVKKQKLYSLHHPGDLDLELLPHLPVVVCVAMYRTNGALERNVSSIGRKEGHNLWHFS